MSDDDMFPQLNTKFDNVTESLRSFSKRSLSSSKGPTKTKYVAKDPVRNYDQEISEYVDIVFIL